MFTQLSNSSNHPMTSWASVAKRNIPSTPKSVAAPAPAPTTRIAEKPSIPFNPDLCAVIYACDTYDKLGEATLEREEQSQCRPTCIGLKRPDAPTVFPIFRTTDEEWGWMRMEDAIETMRIPKKSLKSACRNGALNTTGSFRQ